MKKIKIKKLRLPLIIALVVALVFTLIIYWQKPATAQHVSKDLKISLSYPKGWYIDNRDYAILLTDYYTNLNRDDKPSNNQIELYIREFSGCHPTIEENLKDPGCGEGGPGIKPNEITFKEVSQIPGGTFYKYIVKSPSGNEFTFYLLENGERTLNISKKPDPSQHEKEFEEIINSIKFL